MDLSYTEEQLLLQHSAEKFLAGQYGSVQRHALAAGTEYTPELWRQFAELGWLALTLPESVGGLGAGAVELGLLMEAFGKSLVAEPFVASVVLGAQTILISGDVARRSELLSGVAEGKVRLALAHSERKSNYQLAVVHTTARRSANSWRLDGQKSVVLGGGAADWLIVSARIRGLPQDSQGIGLFLVPRSARGMKITSFTMADGARAAEVSLSDVEVEADALLGDHEHALPILQEVIDRAIIALASDAVGAMTVLLDSTVAYCKQRVQFGQPIGKFQAIQHRLAELAVEAEEARALTVLATLRADAPPEQRARAAAAVKVKVARAARHVAEQAVQLHGGMGVTEELAIGAYFKRVLVFDLLFGSSTHHLMRYAALARSTGFIDQGLLDEPARASRLRGAVAEA